MTTPPATTTAPTPRRHRRPAACALALTATLTFALGACGSDDDSATDDTPADTTTTTTAAPSTQATSGDADPAGQPVPYDVTAIAYDDLTAPAGGTIEITNTSGARHTFTADDGTFDVDYAAGESATVDVPTTPGTHGFSCEVHPGMQATLTVE